LQKDNKRFDSFHKRQPVHFSGQNLLAIDDNIVYGNLENMNFKDGDIEFSVKNGNLENMLGRFINMFLYVELDLIFGYLTTLVVIYDCLPSLFVILFTSLTAKLI
jgi:hypothetical protein